MTFSRALFFAIEPFNITNPIPSGQFDLEPFEGKMWSYYDNQVIESYLLIRWSSPFQRITVNWQYTEYTENTCEPGSINSLYWGWSSNLEWRESL